MAFWKRIDGFLRGLLGDHPEDAVAVGAAEPSSARAGGLAGTRRSSFLEAAGLVSESGSHAIQGRAPRPVGGAAPPERRAPLESRACLERARVPERAESSPARRFVLSVDHAGEFLVVVGERASFGHVRAGEADLPFLANVGARHAELLRVDSLREGPLFYLFVLEDGRKIGAHVEGHAVGAEGLRLFDGDRCFLGETLSFRFRLPDPASQTALLELGAGTECAAARTIVLFGEGEGGRLRIGSAGQRHVRVPGLEEEIELVAGREGGKLQVRSRQGVLLDGHSPRLELEVDLPPEKRVIFSFPRARRSGPPFAVALAPPDLPGMAPDLEQGPEQGPEAGLGSGSGQAGASS